MAIIVKKFLTVKKSFARVMSAIQQLEYKMDNVPDQPLNPPEPRCPDYNDYLEHEADRLNDELKESNNVRKTLSPIQPRRKYQYHGHFS